jgi:MYXO-CTERM domain-containing protein
MRSALVAVLVALPAVAHAHIYLTAPTGRGEPPNGDPQKNKHCGRQGRMLDRVTTLEPGATITVAWKETINHSGWYRISFQPNGEVFRIPPASNGPNSAGANSNFPTEDYTGMTDPDNGSTVLMDRILDDGNLVMKTRQITLPNIECDNCTLQVISVMTTSANYSTADMGSIYYQCADITLARNAPDAGPQATDNDAGIDPGGGGGGSETQYNPTIVSGGCSTGGASGTAPVALALLGFAGLRRRRRS